MTIMEKTIHMGQTLFIIIQESCPTPYSCWILINFYLFTFLLHIRKQFDCFLKKKSNIFLKKSVFIKLLKLEKKCTLYLLK